MSRQAATISAVAVLSAFCVSPADAWGNLGHEVIAAGAWRLMTPKAQAEATRLLEQDTDTLTKPDFVSRATWADAEREAEGGRGRSHLWHFINLPLNLPADGGAIHQAIDEMSRYPALDVPAAGPSAPADDNAVDKVRQFEAELVNKNTPTPERILALKYLIHLVGDLSQPLHTTADAGGNCIPVTVNGRQETLHKVWDDEVVYANTRGHNPIFNGEQIASEITPAEIKAWSSRDPAEWAVDSYKVAVQVAYSGRATSLPGCAVRNAAPIMLTPEYQNAAYQAARLQLQKAQVRLAYVLNSALG